MSAIKQEIRCSTIFIDDCFFHAFTTCKNLAIDDSFSHAFRTCKNLAEKAFTAFSVSGPNDIYVFPPSPESLIHWVLFGVHVIVGGVFFPSNFGSVFSPLMIHGLAMVFPYCFHIICIVFILKQKIP
ncbi:MAG: hypothetical protein WCL18_10680 [bacterium]